MQSVRYFTKLGLFFIPGVFLVVIHSCSNDNHDLVPYVPVNLVLDVQTDLSHLGVGDAAVIVPDENNFGIIRFLNPNYPEIRLGQEVYGNGLILYRTGNTEFSVFDKTCTFNASTDYCAVEMDATYLFPECPCCDSQFAITLDGAVNKGPAALPLKPYNAFVNNYRLYISN